MSERERGRVGGGERGGKSECVNRREGGGDWEREREGGAPHTYHQS